MASVLIVAYLLIVIAMIVVILLQRSEGGGLGMGGGGGGGGLMTARGSANLLTRTTAILGTLFMVTAIALTIVSQIERGSSSILDRAGQNPDGSPASVLDALDALGTGDDDLTAPAQPAPQTAPQAPATQDSDLAIPQAAPEAAAPAEVPADQDNSVGEPVAPGSSMMMSAPEAEPSGEDDTQPAGN